MTVVTIQDVRSRLSQLVSAIENGETAEIVITRNGKPVARLAALEPARRTIDLGAAPGRLDVPEDAAWRDLRRAGIITGADDEDGDKL
ncbi:hypothetical protein BH09PSE1_BH09PSE1_21290 [soil metagenome]